MHLEMKTRCEKCGDALLPSGEAYICSYECTLCPACATIAQGFCPNCGGELIHRPRRRTVESEVPNQVASGQPGTPVIKPWVIWIVSFGVFTLIALAGSVTIYEFDRLKGMPTSFLYTLGLEFSQILAYAPLAPFVFALAVRYPFQRGNWARRTLLHLAGALLFTLAHITLRSLTPFGVWDGSTRTWVSPFWDAHAHIFRVRWDLFETLFFLNVVDDITGTYVPIVLIAQALCYYRRLRERELQSAQLETQLAKAHLQALKSQLQPHFLFNTMHSISSLMFSDVRAADKMMSRLSDLLRMSLENNGIQVTSLSREIEFVSGYLEIEKVRFEDRLKVVFDIAAETLDAQVPHLLLQPLAENAVRHGIAKRLSGGEIRIRASHDKNALHLCVQDNGPAADLTGTHCFREGLGLRTARERLRTLYGEDQSLEIRALPGEGLIINIRIPFQAQPRPLIYELEPAKPESVP